MSYSEPYTILLSTRHYIHPEGNPIDWIDIRQPRKTFSIGLGVQRGFAMDSTVLRYKGVRFSHVGARTDTIGRVIRMEKDELAQLVYHLYRSKSVLVEFVNRKGWYNVLWLRLWGKILVALDR